MSIVKALIGGLIGAVIATFALTYLQGGSMRGYEWFPMVTGLLTGLGTRFLTGSAGRSVATGGIAALISLLAIFGGGEVLAYARMPAVDLGPARVEDRVAKGVEATEDSAENVAGAEGPDEADTREMTLTSDAARAGSMSKAQLPNNFQDFLPYIFSGLGVLFAYQLGRGSGSSKVVADDQEDSGSSADEPSGQAHEEEST